MCNTPMRVVCIRSCVTFFWLCSKNGLCMRTKFKPYKCKCGSPTHAHSLQKMHALTHAPACTLWHKYKCMRLPALQFVSKAGLVTSAIFRARWRRWEAHASAMECVGFRQTARRGFASARRGTVERNVTNSAAKPCQSRHQKANAKTAAGRRAVNALVHGGMRAHCVRSQQSRRSVLLNVP